MAVRMRNRDTYCPEDVEWADIIFAAGGQLLVIPSLVPRPLPDFEWPGNEAR